MLAKPNQRWKRDHASHPSPFPPYLIKLQSLLPLFSARIVQKEMAPPSSLLKQFILMKTGEKKKENQKIKDQQLILLAAPRM